MKKGYKGVLIALVLALALTAGVSAQTDVDLSSFKSSIKTFSGDVAQSLPYAATLGGSWSDAKVMGFPRFGVGLSAGAVTVPSEAFTKFADDFGITLPSQITDAGLGVPLPGYALDARVGLPILPFDVGAKFGYMTPEMGSALKKSTGVTADYMLAGFDIRYPIIKQKLLIPSVAVSAGLNYLKGGVGITPDGVTLQSIDMSSITGVSGTIDFTDPEVFFDWESTSFDFRVQASEKLLLFTFYAGGGYSHGLSQAGGGFEVEWVNNTNLSDDDLIAALEKAGYDLSDQQISVLQDANGGSFHAFGGFSLDLLILRLDLQGKYNFMTNQLGAGINARIQL
jgi:hypothetical protein